MADQKTDLDKMVSDALKGSWVHRFLPQSFWPYAQLARWERPIGWQLLMWPCLWSLMLATISLHSRIEQDNLLGEFEMMQLYFNLVPMLVLFALGAFLMRGAGCTYNDLVDQNIDEKVARTRSRPLPSGRVSRRSAWIFLFLQLVIGLIVLLQFNWTTIVVGAASLFTIAVYPFMKRITWWPQFFLGLAFSWGALVGWTAITGELALPAILLYMGCICWVIGYDTIYAHQDIEDDMKVGVKSTARLFAEHTRSALLILYGIALILFSAALYFAHAPLLAWLGTVITAIHMIWQIKTFRFNDPAYCLHQFKSNSILGLLFFLSLVLAVIV